MKPEVKKHKIVVILGTRPEATKLAPAILELRREPSPFDVQIVSTGQHKEMLPATLDIFGLKANEDLRIMRAGQSLEHITSASLVGLERKIESWDADLVLVEGDTTTVFAAALAAFYHKVPVAHLEAGLRTDDRYRPYPEEINRRMTSVLASLHLAPTQNAKRNLLAEGYPAKSIYVTGNTAVDAVLWCTAKLRLNEAKSNLMDKGRKKILVTAHRRESWGTPIKAICLALLEIVKRFDNVDILFPVHPNPKVKQNVNEILGGKKEIQLVKPFGYLAMVQAMKESHLILTDSGGIQEEAPSLDKPVLVLREKTERQEGIISGCAKLIGIDTRKIVAETSKLLTNPKTYQKMANAQNPFGDGRAAKRVRRAIEHFLGLRNRKPTEFNP